MNPRHTKTSKTNSADVKAFAHGSGIVAVGIVGKVLLTFATEITAARILLPERYGLITWGLFLANILCMITGLGLNTALRRFLAMYRTNDDFGAIRGLIRFSGFASVITGTVGAIVFFAASSWLADSVFGDKREAIVLQVLVFAIPSWTVLKIMLAVFGGFERPFYKVLIEDFFVPLGFFSVVFLAWILDFKEVGIVAGYAVVYFLGAALSVYCVRTKTLYRESLSYTPKYHTRSILKFSWPLILTEPLGKCTGMIDVLIVGALTTTYQVGIFRAASDMAATMAIVLMCLGYMYLPIISRFIANGEHEEWKAFNARVARWAMLLTFPIFATLFFFPREVIKIIYGTHYEQAAPVLRILALAYFGHAMVGFTGLNLIAKGMTSLQLLTSIFALATNIIGNYLFIPIYGIKGAAIASLLSLWSMNFLCLVIMKVRLQLQPFSLMYVKGLVAVILAALCFYRIAKAGNFSSGLLTIILFLLLIGAAGYLLCKKGVLIDSVDAKLICSMRERLSYKTES